MHAAVKSYGKICLKAIGDTFFLICGLWSGEGQGTYFLGGDNIQQKGKVQTFGLAGRPPPPSLQFSLLEGHPDLPIKKTLIRAVGLLTVMILERVSESIFLQHVKLKMKKKHKIFWWCLIYWRLSIHLKVRNIYGPSES